MSWARLALVVAGSVAALALAVLAPRSRAGTAGSPFFLVPSPTSECNNVPACVAVTGPWVIVPGQGEATYLMKCPAPHGFLVGGTDARASSSSVHVWYDGQLGAPIGAPTNPDSPDAELLFHAVADNGRPGSFEPVLGCISLIQLDPRVPVGVLPGAAPSAPPDLRVTRIVLEPGRAYGPTARGTTVNCLRTQQLVGSWAALAFFNPLPPDVAHLGSAKVTAVATGRQARALISTNNSLFDGGAFPIVQVGAMCEP